MTKVLKFSPASSHQYAKLRMRSQSDIVVYAPAEDIFEVANDQAYIFPDYAMGDYNLAFCMAATPIHNSS